MERRKFFDIFRANPDGSLSPRMNLSVNGVIFGSGVSFRAGVTFGGINFHEYKHLDIATEERDGVIFITGFLYVR